MPLAQESDRKISLHFLERIHNLVASSRESDGIIDQVLDEINFALKADGCWLQLFDIDKNELMLLAQRGFNQVMLKEAGPLLGQILSSRVITCGEPVMNAGIFTSTDKVTIGSTSASLNSFIIAPLKLHSKILGAIGLCSRVKDKFSESDLKLLSVLSDSVAIAVVRGVSPHVGDFTSGQNELLSQISEKQELFSSLGHELQTPLTALIASAGLLAGELEKDPKSSNLRLIKNIQRSASNLQDRIVELLDLSRKKVSRHGVALRPLNFPSLFNEVSEELAPLIISKGQSFVNELPVRAVVIADEQRLNQILLNLLSNAIKFTPRGGQIIVRARKYNGDLIVEVQDTGPGISKREQMKLFRPFYRVSADRLMIPGLGLGLMITKQMVELLGGNIWVDSEPGKGSIFAFSLPLAEEENNEQDWVQV